MTDHIKFWLARKLAEFLWFLIALSALGAFCGAWVLSDYIKGKLRERKGRQSE